MPRTTARRRASPAPSASNGAAPGDERGPAARMRRLLLDTASELIGDRGTVPSVAELAEAAGVSRATAYRYFPSRSKLVAGVVDHSLGPVRSSAPLDERDDSEAGLRRLQRLFESTFGRFQEFEPQMRAALQLSLEHAALDRAGRLSEEPYRRGYRVGLLGRAIAPLRPRMTRRNHELLWKSLSLVYGIEPYVVLKDIWGESDAEVEAVARWMVDALTAHAMREPAGRRSTAGSRSPDGVAAPDRSEPT
ncbi:MAG TPA: TetR/AcrR family transcriptional regulator [Burkholderiaceae bacterium]|nr:TetR/AcrR family transcriptional regulator [Burkholderiaceae bacterium]